MISSFTFWAFILEDSNEKKIVCHKVVESAENNFIMWIEKAGWERYLSVN